MKQTPEQPEAEADLFSRVEKIEEPVKRYPPDLNVRESIGYISPVRQSREQIIRKSNKEEVLSPQEIYGSNEVDDFIPYHKRKWEQNDLQELVDVVREATQEDENKK